MINSFKLLTSSPSETITNKIPKKPSRADYRPTPLKHNNQIKGETLLTELFIIVVCGTNLFG